MLSWLVKKEIKNCEKEFNKKYKQKVVLFYGIQFLQQSKENDVHTVHKVIFFDYIFPIKRIKSLL